MLNKRLSVFAASVLIALQAFTLPTTASAAKSKAATLPKNSLDLGNYANSVVTQTGSPVINNTPIAIQPQIVPSPRTMVQQQLSEYEQAQLTPDELRRLKASEITNARITATPYVSNPEPVVRTLAVSLNPGETPPIIRLSKNLLTTIVFTDNDGNPYYIEKVALNRNQFSDSVSVPQNAAQQQTNNTQPSGAPTGTAPNVAYDQNGQPIAAPQQQSVASQQPVSKPTNILTIEPLDAVAYSNMAVTLKGKDMPVIFLLTAGQDAVDIRVDARIPGRSPDAPYKIGSFNQPTPEIDTDALAILDGSIPQDAVSLIANDPAVRGWEYNDQLYVKTRFDVLYPAYTSKASTPDGLNIFRFPSRTNNTVTFMQRNGQPVTVTFEESPYSDLEHR